MFKKLIVGFGLALMLATAFAGQTSIDTSGLSDAQIAELKATAAKKVAETAVAAATPATVAPEKITAGVALAATWGTQAAAAAEGFAKAMGIAAKELNVSINDFLGSPAGKLTAALIIWKVAGTTIIHMLYGVVFVVVGLTMVRVIYQRLFTQGYEKVEYSRFGGFFKGTKLIRIPKGFKDLQNDGEWLAFWVMIVLTVAILISGGIIIA
jgi:hypothetical protein